MFLAAGKRGGFFLTQVGDVQALQRFVRAGEHLGVGHALAFEAEADFVEHVGAQDLTFRVLQERTHMFGDRGERLAFIGTAKEAYLAQHSALVTVGDKAVDAAHQGGFAAAAAAGQKGDAAGLEFQADVAQGDIVPAVIPEGEVINNEGQGLGHLCVE